MEDLPELLRTEAAGWLARMQGPDADGSRAAFETWLAASPDHAIAYNQLRQRWEQTSFIGNLSVARDRDLSRAAVWHRRPAIRALAAACIALFLVGGIGALVLNRTSAAREGQLIAYESRIGQIRDLTLADGTRVTLDANSAIRIALLKDRRRAEIVRGRARFSFAGDARPFIVAANAYSVTGTTADFDIDMTPQGPRIAVQRGDAEVHIAGRSPGAGFAWRLGAGQQLVAATGAMPQATGADTFRWPGGMLSFDGRRLDEAAAEFNRYNATKIVIADQATGSLKVTGAFRAIDPGGFAQAVAAMFKLQFRRGNGHVILSRSK